MAWLSTWPRCSSANPVSSRWWPGRWPLPAWSPGRLELELTERTVSARCRHQHGHAVGAASHGCRTVARRLRHRLPSLAYLKRFPGRQVEDRPPFRNDLETDPDDWAIASTIVSMGRSLRMTVLAEGVEKAEQLALLRKMGCDMAQGFFQSPGVGRGHGRHAAPPTLHQQVSNGKYSNQDRRHELPGLRQEYQRRAGRWRRGIGRGVAGSRRGQGGLRSAGGRRLRCWRPLKTPVSDAE